MPYRSSTEVANQRAGESAPVDQRVPERAVSSGLWLLAVLLVGLALWLALTPRGCSLARTGEWTAQTPVTTDLSFLKDLERKPVDSLPDQVASYETIAVQPVPNTPQAAEAVYVTLDMDTMLATPFRLYANVEAFPSAAEAKNSMAEEVKKYPADRAKELFGGATEVETGLSAAKDAWIATWTYGQYGILVRAAYDRHPPADGSAGQVLKLHGLYVARVVEYFQRTGQDGIQARVALEKAGYPAPDAGRRRTPPGIEE